MSQYRLHRYLLIDLIIKYQQEENVIDHKLKIEENKEHHETSKVLANL